MIINSFNFEGGAVTNPFTTLTRYGPVLRDEISLAWTSTTPEGGGTETAEIERYDPSGTYEDTWHSIATGLDVSGGIYADTTCTVANGFAEGASFSYRIKRVIDGVSSTWVEVNSLVTGYTGVFFNSSSGNDTTAVAYDPAKPAVSLYKATELASAASVPVLMETDGGYEQLYSATATLKGFGGSRSITSLSAYNFTLALALDAITITSLNFDENPDGSSPDGGTITGYNMSVITNLYAYGAAGSSGSDGSPGPSLTGYTGSSGSDGEWPDSGSDGETVGSADGGSGGDGSSGGYGRNLALAGSLVVDFAYVYGGAGGSGGSGGSGGTSSGGGGGSGGNATGPTDSNGGNGGNGGGSGTAYGGNGGNGGSGGYGGTITTSSGATVTVFSASGGSGGSGGSYGSGGSTYAGYGGSGGAGYGSGYYGSNGSSGYAGMTGNGSYGSNGTGGSNGYLY